MTPAERKTYLAVTRGYIPESGECTGMLDAPQNPEPKEALTRYRRLATIELPIRWTDWAIRSMAVDIWALTDWSSSTCPRMQTVTAKPFALADLLRPAASARA